MTTYDPQTGKLSEGFAPTEPLVPMLGPGGVTRQVPQSQVRLFAETGYTPDTPEARQEQVLQSRYGEGLGNELAAAGAGAARTLSFGLSDLALTGTGLVAPQTLDELRKRNPDATLAGELGAFFVPAVGGVLAGAKALGGVATAGRALKLSGAGIEGLSELAGGVSKAVSAATGSKLMGSAAQAAAEGLAFNMAHNLSEAVLGDSQLTAEKLLANSGQAMLVGAGLGFGVPLAGRAAASSAQKAKQAIDNFGAFLKNTVLPEAGDAAAGGYAKAFGAVTGKGEAEKEVLAMLDGTFTPTGAAKRAELLDAISPERRDELYRAFYDQLDDVYRKTEGAVKRGFNDIRPREVTKLLADVDVRPGSEALGALIGQTRETAQKMLDDPLFFDQAYPRGLMKLADDLDDKLVNKGIGSAEELYAVVNGAKTTVLGDLAEFQRPMFNMARAERNSVSEVRDLYRAFADHLEDPKLYGTAGARQQGINEAFSGYRELFSATKFKPGEEQNVDGVFRRHFLGQDGNISTPKVNAFLNKLGSGPDLEAVDALDRFISTSRSLVDQVEQSATSAGVKGVDRAGFESIVKKLVDTKTKATADLAMSSKIRAQDAFGLAFVNFQKSIGEHLATGGIFNATIRLAEKASSPFGVVKALSSAEGFVLNTSGRIADAVDRMASRAAAASAKAAAKARPVVEPASISALMNWLAGVAMGKVGDVDGEKEDKPRTRREAFTKTSKLLGELAGDPASTAAALGEGVKHLAPHAPDTANAIVETQMRAIGFAAEKAPKNPSAGLTLNPFIVNWQPSDFEMSKFERFVDALQDPLGVLDELNTGSVSPERVEALQVVYPTLFEEVKGHIAARAGELQTQLPYRDRLQLSMLFGVALDPTLDASFVNAIQNGYGQASSQAQESRPAYRPSSAAKKLGALEETPAQRIARR